MNNEYNSQQYSKGYLSQPIPDTSPLQVVESLSNIPISGLNYFEQILDNYQVDDKSVIEEENEEEEDDEEKSEHDESVDEVEFNFAGIFKSNQTIPEIVVEPSENLDSKDKPLMQYSQFTSNEMSQKNEFFTSATRQTDPSNPINPNNKKYNLISKSTPQVFQELTPQKSKSQEFYPQTIYQNYQKWQQILFIHIFHYMRTVRLYILKSKKKISIQQLPRQDSSDKIESNYQQAYDFTKNKGFSKLTYWDLFELFFFNLNKFQTIFIVLLAMCETYSRFGMAILTQTVITAVKDHDRVGAYQQAIALAVLSLMALLSKHYQLYVINNYSTKLRMILTNFVYDKLTDLKQYQIKALNIGKIMNLVSGDINAIEFQLNFVYALAIIPGSIIFSALILWFRFNGPIGLIAILICVLIYPIQVFIQKQVQGVLQSAKQKQDNRIQNQNQLIEGIRLVKMYAWEPAFLKGIKQARRLEYIQYLKMHLLNLIDRSFNYSVHIWGSFVFLAIVYYNGIEITVPSIISTIQLMSMIKYYCVFQVSYALQAFINLKVTFERIIQILRLGSRQTAELKQQLTLQKSFAKLKKSTTFTIDQKKSDDNRKNGATKINVLTMNDASCRYIEKNKNILQNLNLEINQGDLIGIIGKVGSGKSTLLQMILKEMPILEGYFLLKEQLKIAFVEQEPYIYTGTVRNNILFGKEYDERLYHDVIRASCLDQDVLSFQDGDKTQIGEKGANLSGGQRARLSFARALYSQADLYLFDDPLSAVDSKVARKMFNFGIKEFIMKYQIQKTKSQPSVILVTHQIQFALECDSTVILDQGKIIGQGTYKQIKEHLIMFNAEIAEPVRYSSVRKQTRLMTKLIKQQEKIESQQVVQLFNNEQDNQKDAGFAAYKRYFSYWQPVILILFILGQNISTEIINNYYYRTMSLFDEKDGADNSALFRDAGLLVLGAYLNNLIKYLLTIIGVLTSNNKLHEEMVVSILKAPVSYFDTNPSGRIINRFSTDLSLADTQVQSIITDIFEQGSQFIVSLVTIAILQPLFVIPLCFTIVMTIVIFSISRHVVSQLKICDLVQRSPLFDQFKMSIYGSTQIRINQCKKWALDEFHRLCNISMQCNLIFSYSQRCFGLYIDLFGQITNISGIFLIIGMIDDYSVFSQALLLLSTFNTQAGTLRQFMAFDSIMNSINRMFEICDIIPEGDQVLDSDEQLTINGWPNEGTIVFQNVHMQYRRDMPLILKGLSFKIQHKEKIGIVGRTGAGKSSILQALLRMAEIEENGKILIDDYNVKFIGLSKLRSSIGIIPQVPYLFKGTIRENIDAMKKFTDTEIWKVLKHTGLQEYILYLPQQLQQQATDDLFSIGQKQLICLARALLNKKSILVLDEATANVDMATDAFIQQVVKEKFEDCTILTIAHRLNTIADYDKIMVLDDGQLSEFSHPFELLVNNVRRSTAIDRESQFAMMVMQTGVKNSQTIYEIAKKNYLKHVLKNEYSRANSYIQLSATQKKEHIETFKSGEFSPANQIGASSSHNTPEHPPSNQPPRLSSFSRLPRI